MSESREKLVEVVLVVDRSGSMAEIRDDTIGGVNAFIAEQRREAGRARLTLVLFDHEYLVVWSGVDIANVALLDRSTFVPRGNTALLDAWGRAMAETSARIESLAEAERPDAVVFAVVTDGYENASKEYSGEAVFEAVDRHTRDDGWQFVFLGAYQDAVQVGTSYGVKRGSTMAFAKSPRGTMSAFSALSAGVRRTRTGQGDGDMITPEEREEQERLLRKKKGLLH
jgi:Mg-chelatase subunit ChlD